MRDILLKIPSDITTHIKDFLWGNTADWKVKLNQIINNRNLVVNLNNSGDYNETFCPQCGEKELFPFARIACFYCDTDIYKYPFNTFSGGNQGCFYLHNTLIIISRFYTRLAFHKYISR